MWIVRCRVSGGVTGTRCSELKDADGSVIVFDSLEDAEAKAEMLNRTMNHAHSVALFVYRVDKSPKA